MKEALFQCVVTEDGRKLVLADQDGFKKAYAKYAAGECVLALRAMPRRQGNQSMRYYRGVVVPDIAKASGVTDPSDYESVHDGLAWKFLRLPEGPMGEPRRKSTAKEEMSQDEITDYINDVIVWAETSIPDCRVRRPNEIDDDAVIDPGWA